MSKYIIRVGNDIYEYTAERFPDITNSSGVIFIYLETDAVATIRRRGHTKPLNFLRIYSTSVIVEKL